MGNADAAPGRRASHEEVLSDEVADEARSLGEAQPLSRRSGSRTCGANVHGRGPMSNFDGINAR